MALGNLDGLRVLDLYAGSGALAIEALSRGAVWADVVERDARAREAIARNVEELGLGARIKVWPLRLPGGLARLAPVLARAELVFADPPYGGNDARAVLAGLAEAGVLRPGTRLVLESHAKDPIPDRQGTLVRERERRYGETAVHLYRVSGDTPAPNEGEGS